MFVNPVKKIESRNLQAPANMDVCTLTRCYQSSEHDSFIEFWKPSTYGVNTLAIFSME